MTNLQSVTKTMAVSRNQREGKAIRVDILNAASHVFGTKGYDRATLDDVAEVVGMQKGSLYYHIDSKEQLLLQIHERLNTTLLTRTKLKLGGRKGTPADDLADAIRVLVELIAESREEVRVALKEYHHLSPENALIILDHRKAYMKLIADIIKRIMSNGSVPSRRKLEIIAFGVLGMAYFVSEWYDEKKDAPEQIADIYTALIMRGLPKL